VVLKNRLKNRQSCMEQATFSGGCVRGGRGGGKRSILLQGVDCMCVAHMSKNRIAEREYESLIGKRMTK